MCSKCNTRLVVLDGDAKAYRTVCSFDSKKVVRKGELNEFQECAESPLPGKLRCGRHQMVERGDANLQGESSKQIICYHSSA